MTFIVKPWVPFFVSLLIYIASIFLYEFTVIKLIPLILIGFFLLLIICINYILSYKKVVPKLQYAQIFFPRTFAILVVSFSILEYCVFGIPLIDDVLYVDFGFPLIHHIVVTSWVLIFISKQEPVRFLKVLLCLFAILNPLLMLNRDVFLLTAFCLAVVMLDKKLFGYKTVFIGTLFILVIFGMVGELRSPLGLAAVSLPFTIDTSHIPNVFMWILIYVTRSAFNTLNNFDSMGMNLYSQNINVFSESYQWIVGLHSYFGAVFFYFFASLLLLLIRKISLLSTHFYPLYIYSFYQAYMTIFSTKFFTTNSLFTSLIFCIFFMLSNAQSKTNEVEIG